MSFSRMPIQCKVFPVRGKSASLKTQRTEMCSSSFMFLNQVIMEDSGVLPLVGVQVSELALNISTTACELTLLSWSG